MNAVQPQATLLIVDDEPTNLAALSQLLRPLYRVRAVTSGEQALRAAAEDPRPDLILLDVLMPGMDGHEVLARLRADATLADLPVIFLTALGDARNEELGLQLGAADYVTKPLRPTVLLARVRNQLEVKRARDWLTGQNAVLESEVQRRMAESERTQKELSELTQRLLRQEKVTTQRIAQALHDHLGQTLAVARLNLDAAMTLLGPQMPPDMHEQCSRMAWLLEQAVREVRQVLTDLRPPLLDEQGLASALDNEIRTRSTFEGVDVLLEADDEVFAHRWPADVEYSAFMVAREAVANARQHAQASLIRVSLDGDAASLALEVIDDGGGIADPMMKGRPGHLGIVGMRERAVAIGAVFRVRRGPTGGTVVSLHWQAAT